MRRLKKALEISKLDNQRRFLNMYLHYIISQKQNSHQFKKRFSNNYRNTKCCGFRAIPCRFRFQNTKTDKESGNSCKIRVRRMHSIETDLEGIAVFLVRFCIPSQLGYPKFCSIARLQTWNRDPHHNLNESRTITIRQHQKFFRIFD